MLTLARHWWIVALRGLVAILFGVVALLWPDITLTALIVAFGIYSMADGVAALIAAFRAAGQDRPWLPFVLEGVVAIGAGVLALVWPGLSALALLYVIAAAAIVTGLFEIVAAIRLRREVEGELWLALAGLASIAFGVVMAIFPGEGAVALVWLVGTYAIVLGVLLVALAFRLRGLRDTLGV